MTELKEMLEKLWANSDVVTIESIIDFMNDYGIEKEKGQIKKAYKDCHDYLHIYGLDSEKYFNDEYKN